VISNVLVKVVSAQVFMFLCDFAVLVVEQAQLSHFGHDVVI
jgi:hypothetical protein